MARTIDEIRNEILDYFENNEDEFNELIEELDGYNGYLNDDRYYDMDEFDELHSGSTPWEIARAIHFGNFNPCDNYFRYNAYGNLESNDYRDYSAYLDDNFVDEVIENRDEFWNLPDALEELLDELEEAENEDEEEADA